MSGSLISRVVGRRLICWVKIGVEGLVGLLGALELDSFLVMWDREQRGI